MTHPHEGVEWFKEEMAAKFEENSHKRGWDDMDPFYGLQRIKQEVDELETELEEIHYQEDSATYDEEEYANTAEAIIQEAADVANFALMIAYRYRHSRKKALRRTG